MKTMRLAMLAALLAMFPITCVVAPRVVNRVMPHLGEAGQDPFVQAMHEISVRYARLLDGLPEEEAVPVKAARRREVEALCREYGRPVPAGW